MNKAKRLRVLAEFKQQVTKRAMGLHLMIWMVYLSAALLTIWFYLSGLLSQIVGMSLFMSFILIGGLHSKKVEQKRLKLMKEFERRLDLYIDQKTSK